MAQQRTLKVIPTQDGSATLYLEELNETFHSLHGAVRESTHVFIQAGLDALIKAQSPSRLNILEVGFGTGLNVLLSMEYLAGSQLFANMLSLEPFPLPEAVVTQLNYQQYLGAAAPAHWEALHRAGWNSPTALLPNFTLTKSLMRLEDYQTEEESVDLVYYDAFAPSKQAEMWEMANLEKVSRWMKKNAILVTYCANGQFKRNLRALGLTVESLPGPPGKKEMVRASK